MNDLKDQVHPTIEKRHGGIEIRRYSVMGNTEHLLGAEKWEGLCSIGMAESERKVKGQISSIEQRYYLLSIESDVNRFGDAIRNHWSMENQLY